MAEFIFKCPQCGQEITAEDSFRGSVVECPYCGKGIVVPRIKKVQREERHQNPKVQFEEFDSDTRNKSANNEDREAKKPQNAASYSSGDFRDSTNRILSLFVHHKKYIIGVGGFLLVLVTILTFCRSTEDGLEFKNQYVDDETCQIMKESMESSLSRIRTGAAYRTMKDVLQIVKVIPNQGVMVSAGLGPVVFIKTKRDYVDGSTLMPGVYVCTGILRYKDENGSLHTMRSFREMDEVLALDRIQKMAQEEAEAEAKRKKIAEQVRIKREQVEEEARFEREKRELEDSINREKANAVTRAAREAHDREIAKLKAESEIKRAKEKAEADAKAEAERIKRYPEEQRVRKEYAALKLSVLNFDVKKHFNIQSDLKKYIRVARPIETLWKDMQVLHKNGDWLGLLSKISGNELKDYPDTDIIDGLITKLRGTLFHMEFRWTYQMWRTCVFSFVTPSEGDKKDTETTNQDGIKNNRSPRGRRGHRYVDTSNNFIGGVVNDVEVEELESQEGIIVPFAFGDTIPICLFKGNMVDYVSSPLSDWDNEWDKQKSNLERDQKQGRITAEQYDTEIAKMKLRFCEHIRKMMISSAIKLDPDSEKRITH